MALSVFYVTATATTEIYTLSLHAAVPISDQGTACDMAGTGRAGASSLVGALRMARTLS